MPITAPATPSSMIVRNTYDFVIGLFSMAALLGGAGRGIPAGRIRKLLVVRTTDVGLLEVRRILRQCGDDEQGPVAFIVPIEKLGEDRICAVGNAVLLQISRPCACGDDL